MRRARLVPADARHVGPIAARARPADVAELWAVARVQPADCMALGLTHSLRAYTALLDGAPVCMFGLVRGEVPASGVPWMVGTTALDALRAQREVLRISRAAVAEFQALCPLLYNIVDARNAAALRWLRWLGFTVAPAQPLGVAGELFHPFHRGAA